MRFSPSLVSVRPLPEPPGDGDAHAAGQTLRDVLSGLAPHVAGQEQAVAVLPLPVVALSLYRGVLATWNLATGWPEGVTRSSGSSTRLPVMVKVVSLPFGSWI